MSKVVRFPDTSDEIIHVRFYLRGLGYQRSRRLTLRFYIQNRAVNVSISGRPPLGPDSHVSVGRVRRAPITKNSRPIIGAMTHFLPGEG